MAKGQTTQPLVVWVWEPWAAHPEILALLTVGHTIITFGGQIGEGLHAQTAPSPDLILHPAAWRWGEWAWPYLNQAIMEARRAKRAQEAGA